MFWEDEKPGAHEPTDNTCKMPPRDPPIQYRDLPSASFNQTATFQLLGSIADAWPLDTQHFGEQVLSDWERVAVAAISHHEQPTGQPLLETVRIATDTMTCSRKAWT
jgi:hypothetical protein